MMERQKKIALTIGSLLVATDLWMNWPRAALTLSAELASESLTSIAASRGALLGQSHEEPSDSSTLHPKMAAPEIKSEALSEADEALCRISKRTDVPLTGDLRVQMIDRVDGGSMYWLKSSECPAELYSIVWIDRHGRIDKEISCLRTTLTELTLNSGLQSNIEIVPSEKNARPLAISGNGRFLVHCPDTGLTLTRDGRFHLKNGALENSEGCIAWTLNDGGRKVVLADGDPLDDRGCSETTGECLGLYEPDERDTDAFNFKTNKSLMVLNERGLKKSHSGMLFQSALEDLDTADRSLTGVGNWETTRLTTLPSHCP